MRIRTGIRMTRIKTGIRMTQLLWILLLVVAGCLGQDCQDGRMGNCNCQSESIKASYELFCPSFLPNLQKLHIVVERDNFVKMTCTGGITWIDMVTNIDGLKIGDINTLKVINCPVPVDSFSSMLTMMGVKNTTHLDYLAFTLTPRGGSTELQGYHFANLTGLVSMELTRAGIKKIDKTFFVQVPGLKSLDLTNNRGVQIDPGSFQDLVELQMFTCHSCFIQSLHVDAFKGLGKLRRISLHDNKLQELPLGIFNTQVALSELNLKRNSLTSLPEGVFDEAKNLTDLDISYNPLQTLPDKLFSKNQNFKKFEMIAAGRCQPFQTCDPKLHLVLSPSLFKDSSVEVIRIAHSPVKDLPAGLFSGCSKLVNLTIQFSKIVDIPPTLFSDTKAIKLIDFSGNQVRRLASELFENLKEVETLRFIQNNLTRLDDYLLASLKKLKVFHFHENHLFDLPKKLFSQNKRIEEIDLAENNLSEWPSNPHVFEYLETLNLAGNKISFISSDFTANMLNLKVLNMSHNLIGHTTDGKITYEDFTFLAESVVVDFSFNEIKTLDLSNKTAARLDRLDQGSQNPRPGCQLDLTGNPLTCDCWATELKQKAEGTLTNSFMHRFTLSSHELRCAEASNHPDVAGKLVQEVEYSALTCPFPSNTVPNQDCTDKCRCSLDRYNRESIIDCTHLDMTTFPSSLPLVPGQSDKVVLNMTGNRLHNLTRAVAGFKDLSTNTTHYQDITSLILTDTALDTFSHTCLPPRLTFLALDQNQLGSFSQADVNFFDRRIRENKIKLKLGRNPYNCTCKSRPLFNFIKSQGSKVEDLDDVEIICDNKVMKVWTIEKREEFCSTGLSVAAVGGISMVFVFLLLVCAVLTLWIFYKEHVTIYVYSKPYFRMLFTEDLIDQEKPYDVFLSYSHEDEDWVEQVLAVGLEKPSEGGEVMQYKCCIHTRDWKVGEMIPDQIIQSVESSRRTLIVLSQAYVNSMWTKLEFRAAHTQALQDKTQRVILVVRDKAVLEDKEKLADDLQKYISLNTYLDSEDPWFWQKLRYALPHRGGGWRKKRTRRETDRMELMRSQAEQELGKRSPSPRLLSGLSSSQPPGKTTSLPPGPPGLTGGHRGNGLVSPMQGAQQNGHTANGHTNNGFANGHTVSQVMPV